MHIGFGPAILLLGIYPIVLLAHTENDINYIYMHIDIHIYIYMVIHCRSKN